jgi:DNA-binding MarR family transcriptional regulator
MRKAASSGQQPLIVLIKTLQQALGARLDASLEGTGVTLPQLSALATILRIPKASNAELARAAFMTPQSMNEHIATLERAKLVKRSADPANARVLRATLTPRGLEVLRRGGTKAAEVEAGLTSVLSAQEERQMRSLLERLVGALGAEIPPRRPFEVVSQRMRSPQTLSERERRIVAAWAADCAERVLRLFEAERPHDNRPRDAIARTRAFARGELDVAEEIRRRFAGGGAARDVIGAAAAAARAAGQASGIPHMGAHALGAAAYAAKAAGLAEPERPEAVNEEIRWQLRRMSAPVRAALRKLPPVGRNSSGPLGPGLLARGVLGTIIREIQRGLRRNEKTQRSSRSTNDHPRWR